MNTRFFRLCCSGALICLAQFEANAAATTTIVLPFSGLITQVSLLPNTEGLLLGDPFTGTITYDEVIIDGRYYFSSLRFQVIARGFPFYANQCFVHLENESDRDLVRLAGVVNVVRGGMFIEFQDHTARLLTNEWLTSSLRIGDFDAGLIAFQNYSPGFQSGGFVGKILGVKPRLTAKRAARDLTICWESESNRLYQIQWKTSVSAGWINWDAPVLGTGLETCVSVPPTNQTGVYRIEASP